MAKKQKFTILKMKDKFGNLKINKKTIFSMPFRCLIVGKSEMSGKSNFIGNLILRPEFYRNDFHGDDIFIISPTTVDDKFNIMIKEKEIPECNIIKGYDEDIIIAIYEMIKDDFIESINNNVKPKQKLIIMDDCSAGGNLKGQKGIISVIFSQGRHYLLNIILSTQKYSSISTVARENSTGLVLFSCSDKQLQLIGEDHNIMKNKKDFRKSFRNATDEPHSFMVINYSNPKKDRYQDSEFNSIILDK